MLQMQEQKKIRRMYEREGRTLQEISESTGRSYGTVEKYAKRKNWNEGEPVIRKPKPTVLDSYKGIIDGWLTNDLTEPRDQRHTGKRVYERLRDEHGYTNSRETVVKYVSQKKLELYQPAREGFIPLAQPPGHAQIDFGHFKYYDGLQRARQACYLIVSFPYSNSAWVQISKGENQECLLIGLKRIFAHIGGTPAGCRLDNMSTAVITVGKGTERILTDGFTRFMLHYRFEASFCNPAKGNEKGNVENKVGYSRRNMFVPVPTITDFDQYNAELLSRCDSDMDREHYRHKRSIRELWEEEQSHLLTLPETDYEVFRYSSSRVSPTGFACVDFRYYGLSPEFGGVRVDVKIWADKVEFFYEHRLITSYARQYEDDEVSDWRVYLNTLRRKPGALEHSRYFNQMPKLWQEHLKTTSGSERKSALTLLRDIVTDGNESLADEVLEFALEQGRSDCDSIRQCYKYLSEKDFCPPELTLERTVPRAGFEPDLFAFDSLMPHMLETVREPWKDGEAE